MQCRRKNGRGLRGHAYGCLWGRNDDDDDDDGGADKGAGSLTVKQTSSCVGRWDKGGAG